MTTSTIVTDRPSASSTSWMAPLMKVASSLVTRMFMPFGSVCWIFAAAARTPVEMSSVFDCAGADDAEPDAGLAVGAQRRGARIAAERHRGDVAQPGAAIDDDALERFRAC